MNGVWLHCIKHLAHALARLHRQVNARIARARPGGELAGVHNLHLMPGGPLLDELHGKLARFEESLSQTRDGVVTQAEQLNQEVTKLDQSRAIFQESSGHITIGMDYVPGVARFLIHCRETGGPFDFLTWFEFAPEHEAAFDALLDVLRASPEWAYVEREFEVRARVGKDGKGKGPRHVIWFAREG